MSLSLLARRSNWLQLARISRVATYATHAPESPAPAAYPTQPSSPIDPELDPQLADMGYPNIPSTSRQLRSPRGWWDNQERINFGEPLPESDDLATMWAPDVHRVKPSSALTQLLMAFAGVGLFSLGVYGISAKPHAIPRGYAEDAGLQAVGARPLSENEIED